MTFPRLFALSMNPMATVVECWGDTWNLALAKALSDQRVAEFLFMQQSILHKRPQSELGMDGFGLGHNYQYEGCMRDYVRGIMRRTRQYS